MNWEAYEEIKDCGAITYKRFEDERGWFQELWNKEAQIRCGAPLPWAFPQSNTSFSHAGVLRGFHIQRSAPQGKLVTCLAGRVMDVCLDLRPGSPTYLRMTRVILDGGEPKSFWLPAGCAHAFIALTDSLLHYACSTIYDPDSEGGVNASSPELAMVWPPGSWTRSAKDRALPNLMDYLKTLT